MSTVINYLFSILIGLLIVVVIFKAVLMPLYKDLMILIKLKRNGEFSIGHIVGFEEKEDPDGKTQYAKVIRFETDSRVLVVFKSKELFYVKPSVGKTIKVLYDPNNPENAIENFSKTLLFKGFLIFLISSLLIIIMLIWYDRSRDGGVSG